MNMEGKSLIMAKSGVLKYVHVGHFLTIAQEGHEDAPNGRNFRDRSCGEFPFFGLT
jgi:hypothetical protein